MAEARADAPAGGDAHATLLTQAAVAIILVAAWESAGRAFGHGWTSLPSLIAVRLGEWAASGLARHAAVTLFEIAGGLALGASGGIVLGLVLGRTITLSVVLRPFIVGLYSVPIVTLAPLLILWFGLDMTPKIVLVALSTFFLLFFNTFAGVQAIDRNLVEAMRLMGASAREEFARVILPGAVAWIVSGLKIAVPYAFAAAVTGELLAARDGIGSLLAAAAAQFDMTGLYAALVVLMALGTLASALATRAERWLLRWRPAAQ